MRRRFTQSEQRFEAARELAADVVAARSEFAILRRAVGLPAAFVFVATPNLPTASLVFRLISGCCPRCVGVRPGVSVWADRCAASPMGALEDGGGERQGGQGRFTPRDRFARGNPVRSHQSGGGLGNGVSHGCGRPGNACVPPANGTARPPPFDAGGTQTFPGRAMGIGVRPRVGQRETALGLDTLGLDTMIPNERFGNMCGADGWPQGSRAGHGPGGSRPSGGTRMNAGGIR